MEIAKDERDFTFAIADEDEMNEMFKEFRFDDSGEEINIGILGPKDTKYPMAPMEDFDADQLRDFIISYKKGMFVRKLRTALALVLSHTMKLRIKLVRHETVSVIYNYKAQSNMICIANCYTIEGFCCSNGKVIPSMFRVSS